MAAALASLLSALFSPGRSSGAAVTPRRVRADLWLAVTHGASLQSGGRLCAKPPSAGLSAPPDQIGNLLKSRALTVNGLGSQLLHRVHVVDHDAPGDV